MNAKPRLARSTDAVPLARLAEHTFRAAFSEGNTRANMDMHCAKNYRPDVQAREIADPAMRTLVCEDAGALIGYGQLRLGVAPDCVTAERPAQIQRIYVERSFHGTGVARALMSELLALAVTLDADRIWLGVWEHNPRARAFYRKFGFEAVGEHSFRFGDEIQTDLVLARPAELERRT